MFALFKLSHPFWKVGFRPFFFGGAVYGAFTIALWGLYYGGYGAVSSVFISPIVWHAHEIIFGFTMAIVAGFLLTAVSNWTGTEPVRRGHLAILFFLWLLGRIVMNVHFALPEWAPIFIQLSFIPLLAVSIATPLFRRWNKRNFIFLVLLGILFVCNILVFTTESTAALHGALIVVLIMISLIGGRIIPAFTVAALRRRGEQAFQTPQPRLDGLALLSLMLVLVCLATGYKGTFLLISAGFAFVVHLLRLRRYHTLKTGHDPLLWILHVGYIWLVVGLFMMCLFSLDMVPFSAALHTLSVGCIGSMIIGMLCRVTLGHTGRPLEVGRLATLAFYLMQVAVMVRVLTPIFRPEYTLESIFVASSLWSACFVLYLIGFGSYLFQERV